MRWMRGKSRPLFILLCNTISQPHSRRMATRAAKPLHWFCEKKTRTIPRQVCFYHDGAAAADKLAVDPPHPQHILRSEGDAFCWLDIHTQRIKLLVVKHSFAMGHQSSRAAVRKKKNTLTHTAASFLTILWMRALSFRTGWLRPCRWGLVLLG